MLCLFATQRSMSLHKKSEVNLRSLSIMWSIGTCWCLKPWLFNMSSIKLAERCGSSGTRCTIFVNQCTKITPIVAPNNEQESMLMRCHPYYGVCIDCISPVRYSCLCFTWKYVSHMLKYFATSCLIFSLRKILFTNFRVLSRAK